MKYYLPTTVFIFLLQACSSGSDSTTMPAETFDLRTPLITGADESSTAAWDCVFDNADDTTAAQAMNTLTFWSNGRGINGSGQLYDWVISDESKVDGTYDSGDRLFVLEGFTFTDNNSNFTALNISTRNVGTPEETVQNFNSNCSRTGNEVTTPVTTQITSDNIDTLFDKNLFSHNGTELEDNFIVVRSDSSFDGTWNDAPIAGTWEMRNGFWCRILTQFFNPDSTGTEDCQLWTRTGDVITGTRDMGNGTSFDYHIVE